MSAAGARTAAAGVLAAAVLTGGASAGPVPAAPTVAIEIHTAAHALVATVAPGTPVHPRVVVTGGGPVPTGTATVAFFTNGTCLSRGPAPSATSTLQGGAADFTAFVQTPAAPGTNAFRAQYSGDGVYPRTESACQRLKVDANAPPPNTRPAFSAASNCAGRLAGRVFGTPVQLAVAASDPDAGDVVRIDDVVLPGYASFASTSGNPATGLLTLRPTLLDWLVGLFSAGDTVRLAAADDGDPPATATCVIETIVMLA